jgi:flagellar operon protein
MPEINGIQVPFLPVGGVGNLKHIPARSNSGNNTVDFTQIFNEELKRLKFSGHAQTRMASREIDLDINQLERLESAISKADSKNCRESLVMLDDTAFIINVPNKTVVTLFDRSQMDESVITNIDSAVFA